MGRTRRAVFLWAALALAAGPALSPTSGGASALELDATIPLPGVSGRIDHMAVDLKRNRLLVAELGNGTVDAVDLATGKPVHRIAGLPDPQGIAYAPDADLVFVANAGDGSLRIFQAETLEPAGSIALGEDADNIRVDPRNGNIVVGFSNGLVIVDPASRAKIAEIELPAHPEGFQIDPGTGQAFVNIPNAGLIVVVDLDARRILVRHEVRLGNNFPIALDPSGPLLATVFRFPPMLALFDRKTFDTAADLVVCGDADDVFFDQRRQRIYVSCGAGEVAVFQRDGGSYRALTSVPTASGARTSLFVPNLDRLFVARRAGILASDAAVLAYRPVP